MIYVEMGGRLGNQMLLYAFARAIQIKRKKQDEKIVLIWSRDGDKDSLKYFNCVKNYNSLNVETGSIKNFWNYANFKQKFFILCIAVLRKLSLHGLIENHIIQKLMHQYGLSMLSGTYHSILSRYVPFEFPDSCKNILTSGFKYSEKYYSAIRKVLLEEFTPIQQELPENFDLYQKIRSTNSVCVNIRRGDYLRANCKLNVCSKQYFLKAMHIMKEKIPDVNFFIFSDDIEWCKSNIKFDAPLFFERGSDPVWEILRLMYSCKHFILSNSTFSWWGQYLSSSENKVIISPLQWHTRGNTKHEHNPSWILIDILALKNDR